MLRFSGLPCSTRSVSSPDTISETEPPAATPDFDVRTLADRVLVGTRPPARPRRPGHRRSARAELAGVPGSARRACWPNLPPNVHAIVATRRDLRLRLHQLRLAGELAEIRGADLRFTERETRELLDASGIALSEAGRGAAAPADGRVGGGPAARGALPGRSPRPGAVRRGVLRQRPHGRGVPARRDARTPARAMCSSCCCGPRCSIGSTASWPTC